MILPADRMNFYSDLSDRYMLYHEAPLNMLGLHERGELATGHSLTTSYDLNSKNREPRITTSRQMGMNMIATSDKPPDENSPLMSRSLQVHMLKKDRHDRCTEE